MEFFIKFILILAVLALIMQYWPLILLFLALLVLFVIYENKKDKQLHEYMFQNQCVDYDHLDGHTFEHFCADVLKHNDFSNVTVTRGSGDFGIDIIAYKDNRKYAIQCKCYSSNIGNKAVQEAYAGKAYYKADIAVVMTNRYFTKSALQMAKSTNVILWNRDTLNTLIRNSLDEQCKI